MKDEVCQLCKAEGTCLFSGVHGDALEAMRRDRMIRHYRAGQVIIHQGDDPPFVWGVQSGLVKLVKTNTYNQELVIRLVGPGDAFGWRPILAKEPMHTAAEVVTSCVLCMYPAATFRFVVEQSHDFKASLLMELARELREAEDRWFQSVSDSLHDRVLSILSQLADPRHYVQQVNGAVRITVPRTEIAAAVGIAPPTLSKVLRDLAERGKVKLNTRTIDFVKAREN